jgi:hypothetical protein
MAAMLANGGSICKYLFDINRVARIAAMKFRFRFSVRALAIFVTLVCAYFGAWEATVRHAARQSASDPIDTDTETIYIVEATAPYPFIVRQKESVVRWDQNPNFTKSERSKKPVYYYLWLFGPRIKLPVQGEWEGFEGAFG